MHEAASGRIAALDLIRGVAVLGILAVNIAGFAGPSLATLTPNWPHPASLADRLAFSAVLVLFEGKMRLLFTLLFGASMVLFIERADAAGRDGNLLQVKRLLWLLVFGWLHYVVLWWGDILTLYAMIGLVVLPLRRLPPAYLAFGAIAFFLLWNGSEMIASLPDLLGPKPAEVEARFLTRATADFATLQAGFVQQIVQRGLAEWALPLRVALGSIGETAPWMALGMALYRSGFFEGAWPSARMRLLAWGGLLSGAVLTLGWLGWIWPRDFAIVPMFDYVQTWSALPHLLMGLGLAAALVIAAPRLLHTALGQRLQAAGRMAFSNYIATSLVMTAVFSGWGFGLGGKVSHAAQPLFVLAMWALILGWSLPWLAHYRQGPLEWLWRSLTEGRALPFRRLTS